jgi:hypothetical protein
LRVRVLECFKIKNLISVKVRDEWSSKLTKAQTIKYRTYKITYVVPFK